MLFVIVVITEVCGKCGKMVSILLAKILMLYVTVFFVCL